jgi:hypothetical protein
LRGCCPKGRLRCPGSALQRRPKIRIPATHENCSTSQTARPRKMTLQRASPKLSNVVGVFTAGQWEMGSDKLEAYPPPSHPFPFHSEARKEDDLLGRHCGAPGFPTRGPVSRPIGLWQRARRYLPCHSHPLTVVQLDKAPLGNQPCFHETVSGPDSSPLFSSSPEVRKRLTRRIPQPLSRLERRADQQRFLKSEGGSPR